MQNKLIGLLASLLFLSSCTSSSLDALDSVSKSSPKFQDSKPHHFHGRTPHRHEVHGIDVSKWNGEIDWAAVKQSGIQFAFIKSSEGTDRLDSRYEDNWRGAARAGVAHAPYHFYYFCASAEAQAAWFIANVPKASVNLPPVLDVEWNDASPTCRTRPKSNIIVSEMTHFMNRLEAHYGKRPIIYVSVDFYADNLQGQFQDHQFWLRSVAAHPSKTYPNRKWLFWQYTGTGIIPGIKGDTDINVFVGNTQAWRQWLASVNVKK